ncbi:MAG TPA: hypothetical protein V6D47_09135 [Oscillatoriaceae cyanobacterium]
MKALADRAWWNMFAHLDFPRRCLVAGALAGVVLELSVVAGYFWPHGAPVAGVSAAQQRTTELLPIVIIGAAAFLFGCGAFALAMGAAFWPGQKKSRSRARGRKFSN